MSEILHIACTKNRCKLLTTQPKIYPDAIEFLLSLKARCPSISSSIAIELHVPRDKFGSIAIELTFSVSLRRGFKKAGSVLSDIGDSWLKSDYISLYLLGGVTVVYSLYYRRKSTCLLQI